MRTTIRILTLFMLTTSFLLSTTAQSIKEQQRELNKVHKEFMKELKKKYDLKGIYVEMEDDGYWYYHVYKKGYISGIIDQSGKIIVPIKYGIIKYKKPLDEGMSINFNGDSVWHRANMACFHAQTFFQKKKEKQTYGIYRLDGTAMVDSMVADNCFESYEGYVEYAVGGLDGSKLLYTRDGECVIPQEYSFCEFDGKVCYIHKRLGEIFNGGRYMEGAIMLDNSSLPVPCQFASVQYDRENNQWIVTDPTTFEETIYNAQVRRPSDMQDRGVELFWSGKYDEVIDFYSKEGISKPWAKYYSGAALIEKAQNLELDVSSFLSISNKGQMDNNISSGSTFTWRQYFVGKKYDFDLLKNLYTTGYQLMEAYLQEDTVFKKEARHYMLVELDYRIKDITDKSTKFTPVWQKFLKENEAIAARKAEERQRAAQRNEMIGSILGIFVQSLTQGLTNSGSHKTSSYSGASNYSGISSSGGTSSSSSSSSQSSSSQSSPQQYRQCHKCRGTGDIFTTSTVGTYGNDKKVVCSTCGKEHWNSTVHHHKKCDNCNGTGKVAK